MFWKIYCLRQEKNTTGTSNMHFYEPYKHTNKQWNTELFVLWFFFLIKKKYLVKMDLAIILETK